ncbi:MAG TPA: dephospho-CoA kinase [Thermoanaerobaculia bacterium]|nr:dephospho-CoA kinase [Thermoanaerobaculia bacterium]
MSTVTVGLTGGLASGKSTVARWLAEAGFLVVDADRLVSELHQPGEPGAQAVRELLGPDFLDDKGGVDHAKVAARIFADPQSRQALEAVIHPLVRERFQQIAAAAPGITVLEATLLVEAGYAPFFDLVVTVEADEEVRLRRAIERGMDEASARARLTAQGDGSARRAAAHRALDNCCELPDLRRQVDELIEELQRLAARRAAIL